MRKGRCLQREQKYIKRTNLNNLISIHLKTDENHYFLENPNLTKLAQEINGKIE